MKAIILAAGMGTRLGHLTKKIPKCMLQLCNQTLIDRQVEILHRCGIYDITIVVGHRNETIKIPNVTYVKNENFESTNINESLFCALKEWNSDVLVLYGDIVYEQKIISKLLNSQSNIRLAVRLDWKKYYEKRNLHPLSEAENVLINDKKIIRIQKNIFNSTSNQQIGEFLGIMMLPKEYLKIILQRYSVLKQSHTGPFHTANSLSNAYVTDMLQDLIDQGISIFSVIVEDKWCEIDTIEDLENAKKLFQ